MMLLRLIMPSELILHPKDCTTHGISMAAHHGVACLSVTVQEGQRILQCLSVTLCLANTTGEKVQTKVPKGVMESVIMLLPSQQWNSRTGATVDVCTGPIFSAAGFEFSVLLFGWRLSLPSAKALVGL